MGNADLLAIQQGADIVRGPFRLDHAPLRRDGAPSRRRLVTAELRLLE